MRSYIPLPEVKLERRAAPRFQTAFEADIAAGHELLSVIVHDMSVTGCGVEILGPRRGSLASGITCLLRLPLGAILPVIVCHTRLDGEQVRAGLQFGRLITAQLRKLIDVIDAMRWRCY